MRELETETGRLRGGAERLCADLEEDGGERKETRLCLRRAVRHLDDGWMSLRAARAIMQVETARAAETSATRAAKG